LATCKLVEGNIRTSVIVGSRNVEEGARLDINDLVDLTIVDVCGYDVVVVIFTIILGFALINLNEPPGLRRLVQI
jgi:hypothetical protein